MESAAVSVRVRALEVGPFIDRPAFSVPVIQLCVDATAAPTGMQCEPRLLSAWQSLRYLNLLPHPCPPPALAQVMKPTAADVVCLCSLLRGAGATSESKKGQWWKAAGQLASSTNVAPDQQRTLAQLLVLREHKWDAAAAAAAAAELDARKKAEEVAAALEAANLQRQAQEEAAARAAADVARAEEQVKAAAARLAELEKQQAEATAAAARARQVAQRAEAAAEAAAERRAQEDRAATAARRAAADAQAAAARAQQVAADARAGGGGGGDEENNRHWHVAWASTAAQLPGTYTALELVAWIYQNPLLALELQASGGGLDSLLGACCMWRMPWHSLSACPTGLGFPATRLRPPARLPACFIPSFTRLKNAN